MNVGRFPLSAFERPTSNVQGPTSKEEKEETRGRQWTEAQLLGIRTTGQSLLVSAAAGSGKTAMLSERCAYLVCDAPEPYRCDVDELLVVTFTDKAAAEMKSRINLALRERVAKAPTERLDRQLALAEQAQVSTLHSFCSRLLRQHFHLVGIDPGFAVMDGEEAKLLQLEVARELLKERYELDHAGDFQRLVDSYAEGDDERLVRQVIRTHEMLRSLVGPGAWLAETRRKLAEAAEAGLASELGMELVDLIGRRLAALRERCAAALDLVTRLGGFPGYVAQLQDLLLALKHWEKLLAEESLDVMAQEVNAAELPKLPPIKQDTPNKAVAKGAIDAIRDAVKKGPWRDSLRFTADEWRDGMRRALPHAEVFLGLVEQFAKLYAIQKEAARQLDFSDLERFTLEVLRDGRRKGLHPSPTARSYHRLFKHVLVDEYQDINELQDAILSLLSHECLAEQAARTDRAEHAEPNLFCVGDVKQSIYRFRLAEPERFLAREHLYRSGASNGRGRVIDLQANFRSRGPLLEAINGVFRRLMTLEAAEIDYDDKHKLTPGQPFPDFSGAGGLPCFTGSPIELHLLPSKLGAGGTGDADPSDGDGAAPADADSELDRAEREALFIARRIRQIVGLDGSVPMQVMEKGPLGMRPRPARLRDVVILLRSMRYKADQFADILRLCGVPTHSESGTGYFESVEVRDMLALLAVLDNQRQDIPLAAVLRSPLAGLPEPEDGLARIRLKYASRQRPVPFHQAVLLYAREQDDELAAHLRDFLKNLSDWRLLAHRRPLAETVWSIYEQTGTLAFVSGLIGGEQRVANLMYLHERATQFGTFQRQGLSRFLEFLENLRAESDLGEPSLATEAEDVVRVMSIHRSKGLEFPVVVLPDLGKMINLQDCRGSILVDRRGGLGMSVVDEERRIRYPSLASTLVQERLRRQAMAEELRVLYVAMTRAREHLVLVGTCGEDSAEKWEGRWSDHRGPLPADAVTGAGCILDWIGPVAACAPGAAGEIIRTTSHGSAEVAAWKAPAAGRPESSPRLAAAARLVPLDPAPPEHPMAESVIRGLTFHYPYEALARQAAVRSVTSAARPAGASAGSAGSLALPKFLHREAAPSAAEVGTATHLVLQHLDYSPALDAADVAAQIDELTARRVLDPAMAGRVDRDAILWFAGTQVGQLLRDNASRLLRELPVYFPAPPESGAAGGGIAPAPMDHVMVRGRLDVFLPLPAGGVVVDYKTDAVSADGVAERAEAYRPQLEQYREAMGRITGRPVDRVCLAFLTPRVVWELPAKESS